MTVSLAHRGPDAQGVVHLPGCHLGHRRLSIIDLVSGDQPMSYESGRFWIVFNGEIFNYRELRQDLIGRGCHFHTQSDTEVLLAAYQAYGEGMPSHLNGQFAFAIWDSADRKLFAARDRLGEKPFFYAFSDVNDFLFASESRHCLRRSIAPPFIPPVCGCLPGIVYTYLRTGRFTRMSMCLRRDTLSFGRMAPPAHFPIGSQILILKNRWIRLRLLKDCVS